MRGISQICAFVILLAASACEPVAVPPSSPPSPSSSLATARSSPGATPVARPREVAWQSVTCGRLDAGDCEDVAELAARLYEVHGSVGPGYRLVVDHACPPEDDCGGNPPAVAVIVQPGWQSLAMLAPFEVSGAIGARQVDTLDERALPTHLVELVKQAPADPTAVWRPDLMLPEPSRVEPGGFFEITYPGGRDRGLGYALERWAGQEWHFLYDLGARVGSEPGWQEAGVQGGWEMDLVGIGGPGPDRLLIPPVAEPGAYRACTALGPDNICALVEVDDPTGSLPPIELPERCVNDEDAYAISHPARWFVHPADSDRDVAACAFFGLEPFELAIGKFGQLRGGSIIVSRSNEGGCLGYDEPPISHHRLTIDGALGYVDEFAPGFTAGGTWYTLDLGPGALCDGLNNGPALRAGTTRDLAGDYAENRRVLDAMVRSLDLVAD